MNFLRFVFFVLCAQNLLADTFTATIGQKVAITVTAEGTQPFTYQWLKNGVVIEGATARDYVLTAASLSDAASYSVRVSNPWGSTLSDEAVLTVKGLPPSNARTSTALVVSLSPQPRRTMYSQFLPSLRR